MRDTKEGVIEKIEALLPKRCKDKEMIKQYCDILYCLGYQAGYITGQTAEKGN